MSPGVGADHRWNEATPLYSQTSGFLELKAVPFWARRTLLGSYPPSKMRTRGASLCLEVEGPSSSRLSLFSSFSCCGWSFTLETALAAVAGTYAPDTQEIAQQHEMNCSKMSKPQLATHACHTRGEMWSCRLKTSLFLTCTFTSEGGTSASAEAQGVLIW